MIVRYLPTNHISFFIGKLLSIPLPWPLSYWSVAVYAKLFGVDTSEIEKGLHEFGCIGDFFVRKLKPGVRPVEEGIVSPVDGCVRGYGAIDDKGSFLIKGHIYTAEELVGSEKLAAIFQEGSFAHFYLSPRDYHHVHSPYSGELEEVISLPGKLWPVTNQMLQSVSDLFSQNERMVCLLKTDLGRIAVIFVGATNVGKIKIQGSSLVGNSPCRLFRNRTGIEREQQSNFFEKGDLLGSFHAGSSVVLLFEQKIFPEGSRDCSIPVRYGETLNELAGRD